MSWWSGRSGPLMQALFSTKVERRRPSTTRCSLKQKAPWTSYWRNCKRSSVLLQFICSQPGGSTRCTVGWHMMCLKNGLWPRWTSGKTSPAISKMKHRQLTGPKARWQSTLLSRSTDAQMTTSSQKRVLCSSLMIWSTIWMLYITSHGWWCSGWWSRDSCSRKWCIFQRLHIPVQGENLLCWHFFFWNWHGHHKWTSLFWVRTWEECVWWWNWRREALCSLGYQGWNHSHIQRNRPPQLQCQKADPALWQYNTFTQQADCSVCANGSNTA